MSYPHWMEAMCSYITANVHWTHFNHTDVNRELFTKRSFASIPSYSRWFVAAPDCISETLNIVAVGWETLYLIFIYPLSVDFNNWKSKQARMAKSLVVQLFLNTVFFIFYLLKIDTQECFCQFLFLLLKLISWILVQLPSDFKSRGARVSTVTLMVWSHGIEVLPRHLTWPITFMTCAAVGHQGTIKMIRHHFWGALYVHSISNDITWLFKLLSLWRWYRITQNCTVYCITLRFPIETTSMWESRLSVLDPTECPHIKIWHKVPLKSESVPGAWFEVSYHSCASFNTVAAASLFVYLMQIESGDAHILLGYRRNRFQSKVSFNEGIAGLIFNSNNNNLHWFLLLQQQQRGGNGEKKRENPADAQERQVNTTAERELSLYWTGFRELHEKMCVYGGMGISNVIYRAETEQQMPGQPGSASLLTH